MVRSFAYPARRRAAKYRSAAGMPRSCVPSPSAVIREQGRDPDEVYKELAESMQSMKDAGLPDEFISVIFGILPARKMSASVEGKDVMLRVSPDVARVLKSNQNTFLQELEEILGRTVIVKSDPQLHLEKFDLA